MSYTAYERTAGTSAIQMVEALQLSRTNDGTFDTSSTPTLAMVESFLTQGSAELAVMLLRYGYAQAQTDSDVLTVLQRYNVYAACLEIEMTQPSAGWTDEEATTRIGTFAKWKAAADEMIRSDAFALLGGTKQRDLSDMVSYGGASISDKDTIEEDSDFEPYTFSRNQFGNPPSNQLKEE